MEQQQGANVIKIRPASMEIAVPSFTPTVVSSPANIFVTDVQAQSYSADRISWTFRSPSSSLLASPLAYGVFRVKVTAPYKLNRADQIGPLIGQFDCQAALGGASVDANTINPAGLISARSGYGYRPLLCFGEGNTVSQAAESCAITINGATWTCLNQNLYERSLDRCFVPDKVAQKTYSTCGGAPNAYDDRPLSGHCLGITNDLGYAAALAAGGRAIIGASANLATAAATGNRPLEGLTFDSGLHQRMENFYDQVRESAAVAATDRSVTLEIKFPISGSVFNSQWGSSGLSRSDPRLRMALGIPHLNQCTITYNFKDLLKSIIRRLGRPNRVANAADNVLAGAISQYQHGGSSADDIRVEFDESYAPRLQVTYIRLPAFRQMPQSAALAVYRREIRRPQGMQSKGAFGGKAFNGALFGSSTKYGLRCTGDFDAIPTTIYARPPGLKLFTAHQDQVEKIAEWVGVQYPQPPSFLFVVFQKDLAVTQHRSPFGVAGPLDLDLVAGATAAGLGTDAAGQLGEANKWGVRGVRGVFTDADTVQVAMNTSLGAVAEGNADTYGPHARFNAEIGCRYIAQCQDSNAAIMQLEITVQSAVGSWTFQDQAAPYHADRDLLWRKHTANCCSSYMSQGRGRWQDRASCCLLSSSDWMLGMSTSPGVQFPVTLDIRCKFQNRASVATGACYTTGTTKGKHVFEDFMVGTPVLVGCFNNAILSIASSSAVLSQQSFSQATAAAALASG